MHRDVDFALRYPSWTEDVNLLDDSRMLDTSHWNVDDDSQNSNDDSQWTGNERNHPCLIVAAENKMMFDRHRRWDHSTYERMQLIRIGLSEGCSRSPRLTRA